MGWFLLIGIFCVLAVIGFFITGSPFKFAIGGIVFLIALAFVSFIVLFVWTENDPCSAPFTDHNSTYCQNRNASASVLNNSTPQSSNTFRNVSGSVPIVVGQCSKTTVKEIGTRLTDGTTGQNITGSGSAINYTNGVYQVSYDTIQGIEDSQVGDAVNLCLVSIPTDCPVGDDRGKVYSATNSRTGESWQAQDSGHSCGGA